MHGILMKSTQRKLVLQLRTLFSLTEQMSSCLSTLAFRDRDGAAQRRRSCPSGSGTQFTILRNTEQPPWQARKAHLCMEHGPSGVPAEADGLHVMSPIKPWRCSAAASRYCRSERCVQYWRTLLRARTSKSFSATKRSRLTAEVPDARRRTCAALQTLRLLRKAMARHAVQRLRRPI